MQAVLSQLNSVPGVIGSLACDSDGRLLAQAFPSLFDSVMLEEAARVIVDGAAGLDFASEQTELLELRFADANLLVKPFPGGVLVVLAGKGTNAHFLNLSASLAAGKIAKLRPLPAPGAAPAVPGAPPTVARSAPPPAVRDAPPPATRSASPPADRAKSEGAPGGRGRVAAPTKGLDELRRRLAGAREPRDERPGDPSVTLPLDLPAGRRAATKPPKG